MAITFNINWIFMSNNGQLFLTIFFIVYGVNFKLKWYLKYGLLTPT